MFSLPFSLFHRSNGQAMQGTHKRIPGEGTPQECPGGQRGRLIMGGQDNIIPCRLSGRCIAPRLNLKWPVRSHRAGLTHHRPWHVSIHIPIGSANLRLGPGPRCRPGVSGCPASATLPPGRWPRGATPGPRARPRPHPRFRQCATLSLGPG